MSASVLGLGVRLFIQDQMSGQVGKPIAGIQRLTQALGRGARAFTAAKIFATPFLRVGEQLGGVMATAVGAAGKLQDSMFEIQRVTGGTTAEMEALRNEFLRQSATLPLSAQELADLGIILGTAGFKAGEAGKEIGKSLESMTLLTAQFAKVAGVTEVFAAKQLTDMQAQLQISTENMNRLASSVAFLSSETKANAVFLGGAITNFGGVAQSIGFTAGEALGLAAALAEVGESAKKGGTNVSKILISMQKEQGKWAEILGITTQEFDKQLDQDAAGTFTKSLGALVALRKESKSKFQGALKGVGLQASRVQGVILNLSKTIGRPGGNSLLDMMGKGNKSFDEGTELLRQFELKTRSFSKNIETLRGSIQNVAIAMGTIFLPVLTFLVQVVTAAVAVFFQLPTPVIAAIGSLITFSAVVFTLTGMFILFAGAVAAVAVVLTTLSIPLLPLLAAVLVFTGLMAGLAVGLTAVFLKMLPFFEPLSKLLTGLLANKGVRVALIGLQEAVSQLWQSGFKPLFEGVFGAIGDVGFFESLFVRGEDGAIDMEASVTKLAGVVVGFVNRLKGDIQDLTSFMEPFVFVVRNLVNLIRIPFNILTGDFREAGALIGQVFSELVVGPISTFWQTLVDIKRFLFGSSFLHIAEDLQEFAIPAFEALAKVIDFLLTPVTSVKNAFKSLFGFASKGIVGLVQRFPGFQRFFGTPTTAATPGGAPRPSASLSGAGGGSEPAPSTVTSQAVQQAANSNRTVVVSQVFLDGRMIWESIKEQSREHAMRNFQTIPRTVRGVG